MHRVFYSEPVVRSLLEKRGLNSFEAAVAAAGGKIQRIVLDDGSAFYFKRSAPESLKKQLGTWLCVRWPRSGAVREMRLLQKLRRAGFETMEPVAWGERRRFGFPREGVLVVREVRGAEVADRFDRMVGRPRCAMMEEVGGLVGRLHASGFFQPVRLKDLIWTDRGLVLIDRETSKPWRSLFFRKKCVKSLTRAVRRTVRDGHRFDSGSIRAFFKGYSRGLSVRSNVSPLQAARPVLAVVRRELLSQADGRKHPDYKER